MFRRPRPVQSLLDAGPLLRDDLLELAPDVAEDVAELEPLAQLLATADEPIHQVLEPGQVGPRRVAAAPAALHQAAQRLGEVALGHDVVGQRLEDLVGVEVGDLLAAVPARVAGTTGERGQGIVVARPPRQAPTRSSHIARPEAGLRSEVTRIRRVARSPVVDRPAGDPFLVDAPGQVQALEQELDGGRDHRRLLGPVGRIERAEVADRVVQTRHLAHPGDVFARRRPLAGLDDEPVLERIDDRLEVIERRRAG